MFEELICSLCCTACSEYKSLQTNLEGWDETYYITVKYFDPILLTQNESTNSQPNAVLCQDCWFHINEFHEFQQNVLKTRMMWEHTSQLRTLFIEVKQEQIQENVLTSNIADTGMFDKSEDNLSEFNIEYGNLKTEPFTNCEDVPELIHKKTDKENTMDFYEAIRDDKDNLSSKMKSGMLQVDAKPAQIIKTSKLTEVTNTKGKCRVNRNTAKELDAIIAEWKTDLICDLCNETSTNFDRLSSHFRRKHKLRAYVKCCERKFSRRWALVNHIQFHLNPDAHKCDICDKSYKTKECLKAHKKIMHGDTNALKCNICEKLFRQKNTLKRHLVTHTVSNNKIMKFSCDVCGIELNAASALKNHKSKYHNCESSIYICNICGKVVSSENALRNHKSLIHLTERKHKCTYCDKAFKRKNFLREHIATHTGEDLYQCLHCPRKFKFNSNMFLHRKKKHPVEWEEARKNYRRMPRVKISS